VFISYKSEDLERVRPAVQAYRNAGINCFWDRTGLTAGEEYAPRLLKEIEGADIFHLFWSEAASRSCKWVEKETCYALELRSKRHKERPVIKLTMVDGPPWPPHPTSLNSLNFDDYDRAAAVGYGRAIENWRGRAIDL
jgi:hypothetical protein